MPRVKIFCAIALAAFVTTVISAAPQKQVSRPQAAHRDPPSLAGIGAVLKKDGDQLKIIDLITNTPAMNAGLIVGDFIRTIDGQPTAALTLEKAISLVRGPIGTTVDLDVASANASEIRHVKIVRAKIVLPPLKDVTFRIVQPGIGLVDIPTFQPESTEKARVALETFSKNNVRGLILDLRHSNSGRSEVIMQVAGFFLGKQPTLWRINYVQGGRTESVHALTDQLWRGPVVALIGTNCYSGELLAAALQDNKRGLLIGQATSGTVKVRTVTGQGANQTTVIATYLTASGQPLTDKGLQPDTVLDASLPDDLVLKKAVERLNF
jgi:carboxyl-terminal processing protease